jgi:hypothetical protein
LQQFALDAEHAPRLIAFNVLKQTGLRRLARLLESVAETFNAGDRVTRAQFVDALDFDFGFIETLIDGFERLVESLIGHAGTGAKVLFDVERTRVGLLNRLPQTIEQRQRFVYTRKATHNRS